MYKLCQTEQSYKRQRELETGLLQLMLRRNYEDISVSDLCEYMQIPRKSFYRYFASKDGALYALIDHTLADFYQMPIPAKKIRGNAVGDLDLYFVFWHQHRDLLDALQRSSLSGILVERATQHAIHERMMPRYLLSENPQTQHMALTFAICGLLSMVMQWQQGGYRETPEQMAQIANMMLTKPLVSGRN